MEKILEAAGRFIASSTVWIFFTVLLLLSYVMIVESSQYQWNVYWSYVLSLTILFAPVLLFSGVRPWIRQNWDLWVYRLLWLFSFIVYPLLAGVTETYFGAEWLVMTSLGRPAPNSFVLIAGIALLTCELVLQFNDFLLKKKRSFRWFRRNHLERNLLSLLLVLATVIGAGLTFRQSSGAFIGFLQQIPTFIHTTCQLCLVFGVYYFFYFINHYLLIPRLLKKKGLLYYGFGVAAAILIFYPLLTLGFHALPVIQELDFISYERPREMVPSDRGGAPFLIILLSLPVIVGLDWYRQTSEIATLEKEKSETELNLLKQQFSPHFFFNTLNNLYALSLTKDQQTPEVILQLSDLMRYVIYKGKEEQVSLAEEVQYLEDYIRLEQIRLSKRLDFRFEKHIGDEQLRIPPLLFIIFVENAFKHGISPAEHDGFLHLYLESDDRKLVFLCENSVEEKIAATPGIGLNNLRRRLALNFPGRHRLTVTEQPHSYKALLQLDLV